jgi:glycosyltransferase involved in cell wall biosynthesis
MEVDALSNHYSLIASGLSKPREDKRYSFIELRSQSGKKNFQVTFHLKLPGIFRKFVSALIRILYYKTLSHSKSSKNQSREESKKQIAAEIHQLSKQQFDLIIVHHFNDLELAHHLAKLKKVKVIFNAHEYYPLEFDESKYWMDKYFDELMSIGKKYLPETTACFCVGKIIANKYKEDFGIESLVITNAKPYFDLSPSLLNNGEIVKLIHHGAAIRSRKLELMIDMMAFLNEGYELNLILIPGETEYINELKAKASTIKNIRFIDAVGLNEIPSHLKKYDLAVYNLPATNFNNLNALPNKFFEFIQARLAIVISPSPEMQHLVKKYDLGLVANDFSPEAMANKIKELDAAKIMYYKNQSHKYAKELSVEYNWQLIKKTVDHILN